MKTRKVISKLGIVTGLAMCFSLGSFSTIFAQTPPPPAAGNASQSVSVVSVSNNTPKAVIQMHREFSPSWATGDNPLSKAGQDIKQEKKGTPAEEAQEQKDLKIFSDKVTLIVGNAKKAVANAQKKKDDANKILNDKVAVLNGQLKKAATPADKLKITKQIRDLLDQIENNVDAFKITRRQIVDKAIIDIKIAKNDLLKKYKGDWDVIRTAGETARAGIYQLLALLNRKHA